VQIGADGAQALTAELKSADVMVGFPAAEKQFVQVLDQVNILE
jgi:hypothetical protein